MSQYTTCQRQWRGSIRHAPQESFPDDYLLTLSKVLTEYRNRRRISSSGETTMRNTRSFRMWTKSITLIVLSLGGLTQFGMAKWKTVAADEPTYMLAPALPPAPTPAIAAESRPAVPASVDETPATPTATVSSVGTAAPAPAQAVAPQTGPIRALVTQAVNEKDLTTLTGNTHPLARAEFDQGTAPLDMAMNRMLMVLKRTPEQDAALSQFMDEQQDKSSPNYHQWLTPTQFGQQYGPAETDTQAVTSWLASHGFQIARITNGRTVIEFSGTVAQVQEAFHTEIHKFVVNGEEHWANASDPQIPSALAPVVHGLLSLHNFSKKSFHKIVGEFMRSKVTGDVTQVTSGDGDGAAANNLAPQFSTGSSFPLGPTDFATIYNVQALWSAGIDGTGQTIAIVGETNINLSDVAQFRSMFGLPVNPPVVILDGPDPGLLKNADEPEADLDVEWSGAVAKGATIKFVTAATTTTTQGVDLSALYIIDNNVAPVMSESYGECEYFNGNGGNKFDLLLWQQAAAQGITAMVSSGDAGSGGCDQELNNSAFFGPTVNGLASSPYNVSVGGTDFDDVGTTSTYWNSTNTSGTNASAKSYIPEVPWNNSCAQNGLTGCAGGVRARSADVVGGAGGPSNCGTQTGNSTQSNACIGGIGVVKPSWQTGLGVPADGVRDQPDVSLFASNAFNGTAYVVCESDRITGASCDLNSPFQHFLLFGGTSASSPAFAGIMALVNQKVSTGGNPTPRQGNANPVLYALAAQAGARCDSSLPATITNTACVFYDVTKGNNAVACVPNFQASSCSSTTNNVPGVMVDPNNRTTEAWSSTAGYDMATGLGTVNAFNLASNWNSVTFTPSTATLTLNGSTSALSITHGGSVTMAGAVTPGSASGNVSLLSDASVAAGIDGAPVTSGAYSKATTLLPGGTYNVHAHYAGDGVTGANDSGAIHVTVTPETSHGGLYFVTFNSQGQPSFAAPTAAAVYGTTALLHMLVTNSANAFCNPNPEGEVQCATGTVSVTDNGSALAGAQALPLNSFGEVDTAKLVFTGGVHNLQSTYSGDTSYASNTQINTLTITTAGDAANLSVFSNNITSGTSDTLTVNINTSSTTIANSSQEPNGTVQFFVNGNPFGSPVTVTPGVTLGQASARAQLITTTLPVGTDNITATYSGDTNYSTSNSVSVPVTVTTGGAADMTIVSSHAGSFSQGQTGANYSITATNSGAGPTTAAVSVTDTLPASLTATAMSGSGWSCTVGTLTCTRSDVRAAAASYPAITLTVTVSGSAPSSVNNMATVSGGGETNTTNDSSTDSTTISAATTGPNVSLASSHSGNFTVGTNGVYSFTVTNSGTAPTVAGAVTITDTLPTGLSFVSGGGSTIVLPGPPPGNVSAARGVRPMVSSTGTWVCTAAGQVVMCTFNTFEGSGGIISAGGNASTSITVLPAQAAVPSVINVSVVSEPGDAAPGNANKTVSDPTVVIGAANPTPAITSLSPASALAGGPAFTLTVNGTGFVSTSTVNFNNAPKVTTFVSATQLTAAIPAADIATVGTPPVTVTSPTPGGGTSTSVTFNVNNPTPTITTVAPASAIVGSGAFTLTVNGTGFLASSVVNFNGTARVTTFVNATQLTAAFLAGDVATGGNFPITVTNPTPGGGTSNSVSFAVGNPAPTITTLAPTGVVSGSGALTLTVNGTGFTSSSTVNFNGTARVTTFVSSTQVTAAILAADVASAGTPPVTVSNPAPGGGTSNAVNFNISAAPNPVPAITSLSPNTASAGSGAFTLTVNGSNFVSSSVVQWNGSARVTTFVSATQLTAAITAADIQNVNANSVTVFNPAPAGGTSNGLNFTVTTPVPTLTSLAPSSALAGGPAFVLTVNGSNFLNTSVVQWNGGNRVTTFVSATQLTAAITAADILTAGTDSVKVFTPAVSIGGTGGIRPQGGPSGTFSNALTFTITAPNPVPTLTAISPTSIGAGGAGFTMTLTGTNFVSNSVAQFKGSARTTTFVSATQLTAAITAADIATAGTAAITVFNPTPGGGTTAALTFTITDFSVTPVPTTQTVAAGASTTFTINTATVGGAFAGNITFTASGFPTGAAATFNPTSVAPGSSTVMTVTTTARGLAQTMPTPFTPGAPNRPLWLIAFVLVLALTSLTLAKFGRRSARRLIPIGAFALLLISAGYLSGCAGSGFPKVGSNLGTPAGTSPITVTATSGTDVHTTTVTLVVQ